MAVERRGDPTQDLLERTLSAAIAAHGFPAAAASIITSRDIRVAVLGQRRIDRPAGVTVDDCFGLSSNTKAFTATMLGALVERGSLRWDVTLAEALPELSLDPAYRGVTLLQLLAHRAGLRPWTSPEAFARAQAFYTGDLTTTRLAFARAALSDPPINVPGSESRYSNADFTIAALIGERAAGRSWEQLVTEHVCQPLGIACAFAGSRDDRDQPWPHSRATGVLVPIDPSGFRAPVMQGAGGLALSIREYSVFLQANLRGLRGEDTPIGKASTVRRLHQPVDGPYALGWHIQDYAGARSSVHAGGNGDYYALVAIQPDRDIAVAFLTNDGGDDVEAQASAILKTLLAHVPPS